MPPQPAEQKRKRGRPTDASKLAQDASSREIAEDNDEHDVEEAARPKKRGRKAGRQQSHTDAPSEDQDVHAQPARRGRPPKGREPTAEAEADPERPAATVKNKAKLLKRKAETTIAQVDEEAASSAPRRSGRERRSWNPKEVYRSRRPDSSPQQKSSHPDASSRTQPPPRRPRKEPEPEPSSSTPRRSGRERRTWDQDKVFSGSRHGGEQEADSTTATKKVNSKKRPEASQEATAPKTWKERPAAANAQTKKRRGRPSLERTQSPGEGPSRATKPRQERRRERATDEVEASAARRLEQAAQPKRRNRPEASGIAAPDQELSQTSSSRAPKRHRPPGVQQEPGVAARAPSPEPEAEEETSLESDGEQRLPFRHLRETLHTVPRSDVDSKWKALDPSSINVISTILADAQRPVLLGVQDTNRRRQHASSALTQVSQRLRGKLMRGFPFPAPTAATASRGNSGSYEGDFNFERTMDANQVLENTLNPLLHSVSLLEKEIQKEEDALARDYGHLHNLEMNAKHEAKAWREKAKREHILAPGVKTKSAGDEEPRDRLEIVPAVEDGVPAGLFKNLEDAELATLSKQVGSHMESIKANLQQISGVVPAIARSKAALQQVLLKHLDNEKYESVLLE